MSESANALARAMLSQKQLRDKIADSLFHYTNEVGLYGILESQCLWATHFSFLNDKKEFWYYFEELRRDVHFKDFLESIKNKSDKKNQVENAKSFSDLEELCKKFIAGVAPFIFSFCGINDSTDVQKYENGDLIMWRSYGQKGGYALGLSKEGLKNLIKYESEHFDYLMPPDGPSPVMYKVKKEETDDFYEALIKVASDEKHKYRALIKAVQKGCLHKHPAFKAEDEHRIFCWVDIEQMGSPEKRAKNIKFRSTDKIPHIELNEKAKDVKEEKLPIKKIIVGPCRDQNDKVSKLIIWLKAHKLNISVQASSIPFIGW